MNLFNWYTKLQSADKKNNWKIWIEEISDHSNFLLGIQIILLHLAA